MLLKPWHLLVALVGAFLVGGFVCRGDRSGEAAQLRADSLEAVADSLTVRDQMREADSIKAARRLALIAEQNRVLVGRGQRAERRGDSLARLVIDTASVVPRPVYDATVENFRSLMQIREAERDSAEAKAAIWQRLYAGADSSRNAWRGIAVSAQNQLGTALKRAKWGCYGGLTGSLGYGFVGDRPGVGTVAGLGITCGRRVL
jgi:hypothetical protein